MNFLPLAGAVVALAAFLWALFVAYRASFKTDEVRGWAKECICTMQSIAITNTDVQVESRDFILGDLAIKSSILLEQGRLYFRNKKRREYRTDKHPAYRGYRPAILDELLISHQIALRFTNLSPEDRAFAGPIAQSCEKRFVSLAQMEVGRIAAASRYNETAGDGQHLDELIEQARNSGKVRRLKLDF